MKKLYLFSFILLVFSENLFSQVNAMADCAAGAAPGCPVPYPYPPQTYSAIQGRDNGFNLFIGGNLVIMGGGAEMEGKNFVYGNLDVQKTSGAYNIGYVGAGSYVIPDNGTDMLIVGGNISTSGAKVYFGGYLGAADLPGNLRYKGSVSTSGGGIFQAGDISGGIDGQLINDPSLNLTPYQTEVNKWANNSTNFAALPASANGTFANNWGAYTFGSTNGASGIYVFNINSNLDPGYPTTITFDNFPDNAEIVINMLNTGTVNVNITNFAFTNISGNADNLMERLLWNFPNATTVNINGASQFRGGILSKAANTYVNTSTNSRIVATGNLVQGTSGSGLEFHNYPFRASALISLPVKLEGFKVSAESNKAILAWISTEEVESSYYEVERSGNATAFFSIGKVFSKGNSTVDNNYMFTDHNPLPGKNYYRLKMVDLDGKYTYSDIVYCTFQKPGGLTVYPNPANDYIYIVSTKKFQDKKMNIHLYDAAGRLWYKNSVVPADGTIRLALPGSITSGWYFLKLEDRSKAIVDRSRIYIRRP